MTEIQIIDIANYILENKITIRTVGKIYGIPKSTVHYNVSKKLINIDYNLYIKLHKYLQKNFNEKHIRGGIATKNKYEKVYHKK